MESSALMLAITALRLHTVEIRALMLAAALHCSHSRSIPASPWFPGFPVRQLSWFPPPDYRAPPILESSPPPVSTQRSVSLAPDCRLRRSAAPVRRLVKVRPQA